MASHVRGLTPDGTSVGAVRSAVATDGSKQVERLRALDDERRVQRYTMESTPLPVRDYRGAIRVEPDADGGSTVHWGAEFEVTDGTAHEVVAMIQGFLRSGLEALRERFED